MKKELKTPYPGLRPFERHEDILFFGREDQIDQLLDKLSDTHFLAVLGTSGSGKSSLVKAGLLPALNSGYMAGAGARWEVAEIRPGNSPFQKLASSLIQDTDWGKSYAHEISTEAEAALEITLRQGNMALNWQLGINPLKSGTRLLILIDQFEELFRYHKTKQADAAAFTALLLGAATHPDVYVVITMRSEFLGDCSFYPELPEAINEGLFLTPTLTPEQMADAIQLPARLAPFNGEVDDDLVRQLVREAKNNNDELPLLQHALMRLWEQAGENSHLTPEGLEQLGGLKNCLNAHVEEAYKELNESQKHIAQIMFRALTNRSEEKRDTRRPAPLDEIADLAGVTEAELTEVVEVFRKPGRSFLMLSDKVEIRNPKLETKNSPTLDISHEALIRQWKRLQDWTENEAEQAELYQRLEAAAQRYREGKDSLWTGPALEHALKWKKENNPTKIWAERYKGDFNLTFDLTMDFLNTSEKARDDQQKAEEQQRQNKIKRARWIAAASVMALIITLALAGWAMFERKNAVTAETKAKQEKQIRTESLFNSSLTHASLLARVNDPAEAREVLRQTIKLDPTIDETRQHTRNLLKGFVDIMGSTADKVYEGAGAGLIDVAVSPDGKLLAAAGERGTLVLFDAESGELLKRLEGHDGSAGTVGAVTEVVFTSNGDMFYSAGEDGRIICWPISKGPDVTTPKEWDAPAAVWALALSPDGNILASGGEDNVISLWNTDTGKLIRPLSGTSRGVADGNSLAFSPDGKWLVSGGYNGDVSVWDISSGKENVLDAKHADKVNSVAVSPDAKWIASGSTDKQIIIWDAESRELERILRGHENIVFGLTFSQDSKRLFSASSDNTMRLWDVETGVPLRIYQGHTAGLWTAALHGQSLYTAANDGTVRRWSADTPEQWVWELEGEPVSTAVSPDGTFVAVGFKDGGLNLYALPDSEVSEIGRLQPELINEIKDAHDSAGGIRRLTFNPDGTLIATAGADNKAKLWRIKRNTDLIKTQETGDKKQENDNSHAVSLKLLHTLEGHTAIVHAVTFSPDGRTLVTAGYDGKVGLFDVESGEGELFKALNGEDVNSVSFGETGNILLTQGDWKMRLWDVSKQPFESHDITKAQDLLLWATLRPDSRQIAAVGREQTVSLYDLNPNTGLSTGFITGKPRKLVGHEQTVLRAIYSPDGTQLATVGGDMTVRIWDLIAGKELFKLQLPDLQMSDGPWDFDFRCTPNGHCWIAVPLTMGRLALYRLPYE